MKAEARAEEERFIGAFARDGEELHSGMRVKEVEILIFIHRNSFALF